jgi:hypothetical protein
MVDPTSAAVWEAAKAAGDFIVLPELAGTFDGGAPKYGPGYGDSKEKFLGSDFVANLKDPLYKLNWPHYKSLSGKSSWHLVYVTETQVHVSGVAVTVAPKNPISENVDDDVVWESEVKWFESFTPAPHDAPMEVFACEPGGGTTPETETIVFKAGNIPTGVPVLVDIDAATENSGTAGEDLTVPGGGFGTAGTPGICFMAEPASEPEKIIWYNTSINNGNIGVGQTFLAPVIVDDWRVYYTAATTEFSGSVQFRLT